MSEANESKGYGFCEYKSKTNAESAVQKLNGIMLKGRKLLVCHAWKFRSSKNFHIVFQRE